MKDIDSLEINPLLTPYEARDQLTSLKQYLPNTFNKYQWYWETLYGIPINPFRRDGIESISLATINDGVNDHIVPLDTIVR